MWSILPKCEDCGKQDESVYETNCPKAEELDGKFIPVVICSDCYEERTFDL